MKKVVIVIVMFFVSNIVCADRLQRFRENMTNITVAYSVGYTNFEQQYVIHSVDVNGVFNVFNGGYNYEIGRDHKVYLGLGFGLPYQLQVGYGFISNAFILRWRQDWGFGLMFFPPLTREFYSPYRSENKCINFFFDRFSFGYYIENKFAKGGFSVGITIGMRLDIMRLYDYYVYKNEKKFYYKRNGKW